MGDVLVLNRVYYAVQVASWKKVMSLLYTGHAKVVGEDFNTYNFDQWKDFSQTMQESPSGFIHTPGFKIAIPDIIALTFYDELPMMDVRFTRKNLYKHYDHKCCYCGIRYRTEELNLDHVKPKAQAGGTSWNNIVLSCYPCNTKKGNKTPQEANMRMHYQPSKPAWRPSYAIKLTSNIKVKTSWKKFIDEVYWNSELENTN